jgi:hypothetical protein
MALLEGERFKMRQTLAVLSVGLLSIGPITAQDKEVGILAWASGDYETALKELRPLAEEGDAPIQGTLGFMYEHGQGVPADNIEALRWYRLAAEQGDALALENLGRMHFRGKGVPRNYVMAHMYFRLSCFMDPNRTCQMAEDLSEVMSTAELLEAMNRSFVCVKNNYKDCE